MGAWLSELPTELKSLQPYVASMTLVEYRRKNGDIPPKLSVVQVTQRVLELAASWNEDPCRENPNVRFLLVPKTKDAPAELLTLYEKSGFGNVKK